MPSAGLARTSFRRVLWVPPGHTHNTSRKLSGAAEEALGVSLCQAARFIIECGDADLGCVSGANGFNGGDAAARFSAVTGGYRAHTATGKNFLGSKTTF